jgi:outer membrane protein assembly factor BamB
MRRNLTIVLITLVLAGCVNNEIDLGNYAPIEGITAKAKENRFRAKNVVNNLSWQQSQRAYQNQMGNLHLKGMKPLMGIHTGDMLRASFPKSIAINKDMIYVLTHNNYMRAYESETGNFVWKTSLEFEEGVASVIPVGGISVANDSIFVTVGNKLLYCIDSRDGNIKWTTKLEGFTRAAPVVVGNRAYIQTVSGTIYAVSTVDGKIEWRNWAIQDEVSTIATNSFIINDERLITQNAKGYLQIIDRKNGADIFSGSIIKTYAKKADLAGARVQPILTKYGLLTYTSAGDVMMFDLQNYKLKWNFAYNVTSPMWIMGDIAYGLSLDGEVIAFNVQKGELYWKYQLPKSKHTVHWNPPVVVNGEVFIAGNNGNLISLNAEDGSFAGSYKIERDVYTAPIVANGAMYIIANSGRVIKYGLE